MNEAELIFTALAELSTRQIADENATTITENAISAKKGGNIIMSPKNQTGDISGNKQ